MSELPRSAEFNFVNDFLELRQVDVLADSTLRYRSLPLNARSLQDLAAVVGRDHPTFTNLLDQLVHEARLRGSTAKRAELASALRLAIEMRGRHRKVLITQPLFSMLSAEENAVAAAEWAKVGTIFDMDPELAIAEIKSYVWSVKRKIPGNSVSDHCVPIIYSRAQGSGKTTFVHCLLKPLAELASDAALFSDLTKEQTAHLFSYYALFFDDMEPIARNKVARAKSVLTASAVHRRILMTSMSTRVPIKFTAIGTSNFPIQELVPDPSGHRRFVMLPIKTGPDGIGGDTIVWDTVKSINYLLLWCSILALPEQASSGADINPITPFRDARRQHQQLTANPKVLTFFQRFDPNDEKLMNDTRGQQIKADAVRHYFNRLMGEEIGQFRFKQLMDSFLGHPTSPFRGRGRLPDSATYILK
ncbi:VapE domain-containing protein [Bradyrhizobium sp. JYMT SZCCT0428]|uniref:VapE domain-containing protein n=1 Tax=Bradyrhizobium sp. JYMT SZCCT0428 TaxID=2807673 RepID=UPI001BA5F938|nr:VapE domain-containing protein [Bradyrhizobium sp. JYMT SZCCT0428]MBR1154302.1 hypothetical protein [Bradyrhizobium sp. JYMT SZCCT0428]